MIRIKWTGALIHNKLWRTYRLDWLVVLVLVSLVAFARLSSIALFQSASGADPGNWLAFAHAITGNNVLPSGVVYPPVLPAILAVIAESIGDLAATKIMVPLMVVMLGASLFLLLRDVVPYWIAIPVVVLFAASDPVSDHLAFGSYPRLLGLSLMLFFFHTLNSALRGRRSRDVPLSALLLSLVVGTSHFVIIFTVASMSLYVLLVWLLGEVSLKKLINVLGKVAVLSVVFSLPYFPVYASLFNQGASARNPQGLRDDSLVFYVAEVFLIVFRGMSDFWAGVFMFSLFAFPFMVIYWSRSPLNCLAAAFIFSSSFLMLVFKVADFILPLSLGLVLTIACVAKKIGEQGPALSTLRKPLLALILIGLTACVFYSSSSWHTPRVLFYGALDKDGKEALDWLRFNTSPDAVIATHSFRSWFWWGWWIQGYAERRALLGGDTKWANFGIEREIAIAANLIFSEHTDRALAMEIMTKYGVTHLFVDKSELHNYQFLLELRTIIVFENPRIIIFRCVTR